MPYSLSDSMVNNLVNTVYKLNGKDPYSDSRRDSIAATKGVENKFGTRDVSASTLKNTLNNSWGNVALSLKDQYHPERAQAVSQLVSDGLDRADGSGNGWVRLKDTSMFSELLDAWTGEKRDGFISDRALQWGLENGYLVVGEGGQLLSTSEAKEHGDTVIALHEDQSGPKLALDNGSSAPSRRSSYDSRPYSPYDAPIPNSPYQRAPYSPYDASGILAPVAPPSRKRSNSNDW
ncbi:MAG TPA: hypothetical protein V6D47_02315 [Oscillatoriaceae cyanobacterium]